MAQWFEAQDPDTGKFRHWFGFVMVGGKLKHIPVRDELPMETPAQVLHRLIPYRDDAIDVENDRANALIPELGWMGVAAVLGAAPPA